MVHHCLPTATRTDVQTVFKLRYDDLEARVRLAVLRFSVAAARPRLGRVTRDDVVLPLPLEVDTLLVRHLGTGLVRLLARAQSGTYFAWPFPRLTGRHAPFAGAGPLASTTV